MVFVFLLFPSFLKKKDKKEEKQIPTSFFILCFLFFNISIKNKKHKIKNDPYLKNYKLNKYDARLGEISCD